jgi:hypothetical protein
MSEDDVPVLVSSRDSLSGEWTRSTRVNWSLTSKSTVADQIFRICDYVAHRGLVNVVLQVGAAFFTSSSNCGGTSSSPVS